MSPTSYQTAPPRGGRRIIANPWGAKKGLLQPLNGMTKHIPTHPFPHDAVLEELADQLLECGAVLSQIVSGMVRWQASGRSHPDAAPIPDVARSLVADVLKDVKPKHSRRDLKVAAAIVKEATEAIGENILFVDPDWFDEISENGIESDTDD